MTNAFELGQRIAEAGWVLLTGGRASGVMDAASRGAKAAGGLTIGILPTSDRAGMSAAVDIPIITDLGHARNTLNILSSQVVIACGMGAGTASEVALAIKAERSVILLNPGTESAAFFCGLSHRVMTANSPEVAIDLTRKFLDCTNPP
ncbi:cytochrome [Leptolyngbya sp. 'hensonii']|uniref:SLOG cluster 4 domain-containing protein n=1 Tax=Leptolyngbya sp. 'hensonii' TaxID=1922337 RepID=UPI00094FB574|nr:LOG family protein [Leptolyngbya sp. 'hensonii']OLP20409.1 cytochrome [Leptolyngbya sp. 'hensonii']